MLLWCVRNSLRWCGREFILKPEMEKNAFFKKKNYLHTWGLGFVLLRSKNLKEKIQIQWHYTPSQVNTGLWNSWDPKLIWEDVIYTLFLRWKLHLSCKAKNITSCLKPVHELDPESRVSFFCRVGFCQTILMEPFDFYSLIYFLKQVPVSFCCSWDCFNAVDYKTLPDFSSACVSNDWNFHFWVNFSFNILLSHTPHPRRELLHLWFSLVLPYRWLPVCV